MSEKNKNTLALDLNHGVWADPPLRLKLYYAPPLGLLTRRVLATNKLTHNRTNLRNHENALNFIISNVLKVQFIDPECYCLFNRRNGSYSKSSYNPNRLGDSAVRRSFDFLVANGFLEVRGGNYNRSGDRAPGGHVTRCRAQSKLLDALGFGTNSDSKIGGRETPGITGSTNLIEDPNSIQMASVFDTGHLPIVRMKDATKKKRLIEIPEHNNLERMTSNLNRINAYLQDHWIDLCIPDDQLSGALTNRSVDENGLPGGRTSLRSPNSIAMQRTLYRVFNNETFEDGGRFYGGWWQQIKSRYRKFITINWHPVSEVDFSNMQAAMLYARKGLELPDDAYLIDGISRDYRSLIKATFFKLINAKDRIRQPRKDELPDGWTFDQIMKALQEKHAPIADYFNTGIGIELQRIDSDIAEAVMLRMMDQGQLVLPVHDSFIVRTGHEDTLKLAMLEAYVERMGREIQMELDPVWLDELITAEDWEQHDADVRDIAENFSDLIHQPEYSRYNKRRWDFVNYKGEKWGHTRQWFNG